jgi:methylated-DNA-[protein]-cysteine S-methyltransferase
MSTMTSPPTRTRTHTVLGSPIGELTVVADDGALCGLYFPHHKRLPDPATFGTRTDDGFGVVRDQLAEYFAGERTVFELDLRPAGDAFKQGVWALLREIPYGETRSYGDLARLLGDRNLAQAVGHANALNPISIVVPCHRVVAADGNLTGYAGGLERKRYLLDLEAPEGDRLF